jgi:flagellar hook assembly protein FlgD
MYCWSINPGVEEKQSEDKIVLSIHPNPSNCRFNIDYQIARETPVNICIYDIQGRRVKTLIKQIQNPGSYCTVWDEHDEKNKQVSAGIYFCKVTLHATSHIQKLVVIK